MALKVSLVATCESHAHKKPLRKERKKQQQVHLKEPRLYSHHMISGDPVNSQSCHHFHRYRFMMQRCGRGSRGRAAAAAATIALETAQGHFVLLCQLPYFIQRDEGWRRRKVEEETRGAQLKSANEVTRTPVNSEWTQGSTLTSEYSTRTLVVKDLVKKLLPPVSHLSREG